MVKKRVALFVEAHEGLGHFNIIRQLADALISADQNVEIMILSGTLKRLDVESLFSFGKCTLVHLPLVDLRPISNGRMDYTTPDGEIYLNSKHAVLERKHAVKSAIMSFMPNVAVFEFYPFRQSFRQPDIATVKEVSTETHHPIACISLCRDIIHALDTPGVLRRVKDFDEVIVRGDDQLARLGDSQKEWENLGVPVSYAGYFISPLMIHRSSGARQGPVLIFAGGGYHPEDQDFFEAVIYAKKALPVTDKREFHVYLSIRAKNHILTGKDLSAYEYISELASKIPGVYILPPVNHTHFCAAIAKASMVILRGGYNTSLETILIGTPLIIAPRYSISDPEQQIRAKMLADKHLAYLITKSGLRPSAIAAKLTVVSNSASAKVPFKIYGAQVAAQKILSMA